MNVLVNFCLQNWIFQCVLNVLSCTDPVPGACNQEFPLDIDPNIHLQYNLFETTITFAPANIGYARWEMFNEIEKGFHRHGKSVKYKKNILRVCGWVNDEIWGGELSL